MSKYQGRYFLRIAYICKMFTSGRIAFIIFFVLTFVAMLIWAYRKDLALHKIHFRHSYKVLLALISFMFFMFLIVKIKKFL